jgi:hypothetical protein
VISADRAPFDPAAARAALDGIDLAPCRARGVPHGYVRAAATFESSGSVSSVRVDEPAMPEDAERCIEERAHGATVAAFAGRETTTRVTWFVR